MELGTGLKIPLPGSLGLTLIRKFRYIMDHNFNDVLSVCILYGSKSSAVGATKFSQYNDEKDGPTIQISVKFMIYRTF